MSVTLPPGSPTVSLRLPDTDGHHELIELTSGQVLQASGSASQTCYVGTDENGRFISPAQDSAGVANLGATDGPAPPQEGARSVTMRMRTRNLAATPPPPLFASSSGVFASFYFDQPVIAMENRREGDATEREEAFVNPGAADWLPVDAPYMELRLHAEIGQPIHWEVFDPIYGPGAGMSGVGDEPVDSLVTPIWIANINLSAYPNWAADYSHTRSRLYRLDVWVDDGIGYLPSLRQRQTLAGNVGGPPLRQRQNALATGTIPLRQRQQGL